MAYTAWSVVFGETPTAAKWNQLGTNDAGFRDGSLILLENEQGLQAKDSGGSTISLIKKNASDQTEIGENDVRATRFVPVEPTQILAYHAPGDADWHDLDITAETSSRTFSIVGVAQLRGFALDDALNLRKNGTALGGSLIIAARAVKTNTASYHAFTCELDSNQILEHALTNGASGGWIGLIMTGYWENVD